MSEAEKALLLEQKRLTNSRRYIRGKVTRLHNQRGDFEELSETERLTTLAKLKSYQEKLTTLDENFQKVLWKVTDNEADHPIFKCSVYKTPAAKVQKLKYYKGCLKCANLSHDLNSCRFKFNRKCSCSSWHFSFLCLGDNLNPRLEIKSPKGSLEKNSTSVVKESSNVIITEAFHNVLSSDSILPTFCCKLNDKVLRTLKDGGCQCNFVTSRIAEEHSLKVLKADVHLKINGFNSVRDYYTKIVEVPIKIGEVVYQVPAICIPDIRINIKLPKLNLVARKFVEKGYVLADPMCLSNSDSICDLDFLLGSKSTYCIKSNEVSFGQENRSVYAETTIGVMLLGDIHQMIMDIDYLPPKRSEKDTEPPFKLSHSNSSPVLESSSNFAVFDGETVEPLGISEVHAGICVINSKGELDKSKLDEATEEILEHQCSKYTNLDFERHDDSSSEVNQKLIKFALKETKREEDGRMEMPLLWNHDVSHKLGKNFHLSKLILRNGINKLKNKPDLIELMHNTIVEQQNLGIIEKIDNLETFMREHPEYSFLPHMAVFKPNKETTKCRIVFMSNLHENSKGSQSVSHNQAMYSGPSLNQKVSSSLLHLRFDSKLLIFDLEKAFNQIKLRECDSNRLCFLWYKNPLEGDFSLVAFRNVKLSFGLRCSPFILMLSLYKLLMLDSESDSENLRDLKSLIFQCFYMDNGAFSCNSEAELEWAYNHLHSIFNPYKFTVQQIVTNDKLQDKIDKDLSVERTPFEVKLLGLNWDRKEDELYTSKINLNVSANTKREVLKTIASQYDIFNFNGPLMNRSRLFMHRLQVDKSLSWDTKLPFDLQREWKNISRQANSAPQIKLQRSVGERGDRFRLIACTDASKDMYGVAVYIQNLNSENSSFLLAKNRIVNTTLEGKTIPSLELQAILLGVRCLIDTYNELSGPNCVKPIQIGELNIMSDSSVALSWIKSYFVQLDKMHRRPVFILNRLHEIGKLCENFPVQFDFVSGIENPGDCTTRCLSYKQLLKTNYLTGPNNIVPLERSENLISFTVPNPTFTKPKETSSNTLVVNHIVDHSVSEHLIPLERYSKLDKHMRIYAYVLKFIHILKDRCASMNKCKDKTLSQENNFIEIARLNTIRVEQRKNFPEIFDYFSSGCSAVKDIPDLVTRLNAYVDVGGIVRIKSKCNRFKPYERRCNFPILLPRDSILTKLSILAIHEKFNHTGVYNLLAELRKRFWIPCCYSVVKSILKDCIVCKRFNARPVKLNQSPYREFRLHPNSIPFSYVYMDYIGPYYNYTETGKMKIWILIITCMFTRAVNLKITIDLSIREFLRAFQLHSFEHGIPEYCISDLGSQLVAGGNVIVDYLKDADTQLFFQENGVKCIAFDHYFKGCSQMGGMVEVLVKMTKRLIYGAVRNNVLEQREFEFLIAQVVHIVNRRPVAFKNALRLEPGEVPQPITPEQIVRGYELNSINIIPDLHEDNEVDPEWFDKEPPAIAANLYEKLRKVRKNLLDVYSNEFLINLINQATDKKSRYEPKLHDKLEVNDLVLLREENTKPLRFPLGIICEVKTNVLGEVNNVIVRKGKSGELTKRHVSSLIPLLKSKENSDAVYPEENVKESQTARLPSKRKAALESRKKTRNLFSSM